jgi:hypothetical protein
MICLLIIWLVEGLMSTILLKPLYSNLNSSVFEELCDYAFLQNQIIIYWVDDLSSNVFHRSNVHILLIWGSYLQWIDIICHIGAYSR